MNFPSERILRIAIAFVGVLGVCVATYILISDSTSGAPTCLAGGHGCETVAKSSYSHIAGINVAVFGIVGWILILGTVLFGNDPARLLGFLFTLGGFGFSIYLTYLEIWKIEAICQWCVTNAVLMTICFLLNVTRLLGYVGGPDGGAVLGSGGGTTRPIAEDG
ncbi:MAG TPA: vitamin K epoxide reductase family protein [Solirubrobacterales bacterium]|nr:vitamin K epoxide reductase family protein [Solirubrobacterales bacterium]